MSKNTQTQTTQVTSTLSKDNAIKRLRQIVRFLREEIRDSIGDRGGIGYKNIEDTIECLKILSTENTEHTQIEKLIMYKHPESLNIMFFQIHRSFLNEILKYCPNLSK